MSLKTQLWNYMTIAQESIKSIAGMYCMSIEEVEKILTQAGRELPKPGRPKLSTRAAEPQIDKAEEHPESKKEIPEAVRECLLIRIAELESQKTVIETELKTLIDFIA